MTSLGVATAPFAGRGGAVLADGGAASVAQVGPGALAELGGPALGVVSFGGVLLVGVLLLTVSERTIERAVETHADWSPVSVIYGGFAFVLVGFMAGYAMAQAARLEVTGTPLHLTAVVGATGVGALAGFGYVVLGTWLTELEGARRPWVGVVVGAAVGAVPWLVLPFWPALFVWGAVAAVGLGSPTRNWVHDERTVDSEQNA